LVAFYHIRSGNGARLFLQPRRARTRREYLKRLDERPQQHADTFPATEQLDDSHDAKQPEETDVYDIVILRKYIRKLVYKFYAFGASTMLAW